MKRRLAIAILMLLPAPLVLAVEAVSTVHGTISKIDSAARTIAVRTADGTVHTLHFVGKTVVHGTEAGARDTFHGLKEGSEVVAHYTAKGSEDTAVEVDRIGENGLKAMDGTVSEFDRGGKKLVVKTEDGTQQTFRLTDRAAVDSAKGASAGAEKAASVTVYYTDDAGKKVAHFFEGH